MKLESPISTISRTRQGRREVVQEAEMESGEPKK